MSSARVLIIGCTGLAAEVAKNIVLAGFGTLHILDHTPVSHASPGNFLIPADAPIDQMVSQASVRTLREMNPLVNVEAISGLDYNNLGTEDLKGYSIIMLFGAPANVVAALDAVASEADVPFFAANSRGIFGWAFANLHQHKYEIEEKREMSTATIAARKVHSYSLIYPPWKAAIEGPLAGLNLKRMSKVYLTVRLVSAIEGRAKRCATEADIPELLSLAAGEGFDVEEALIRAYVDTTVEMPAINAVVGGVLANAVVGTVSARTEPLNNLFCFCLLDGLGVVETVGATL